MPDLPQRWLSLSGISTVLNLTPTQIKTLYKQKLLVRIGKNPSEYRYLDPTPEYAERLRLAAVMLSKKSDIPIDLPLTFLLTVREIAEIMGVSLKHARRYVADKKIPCWKSKNRAALYSMSVVRDLIWRRNGRKNRYSAPMLLPELVAYFKKFLAAEEAIVPTDAAFKEDEELQKRIRWMMRQPSPQRETLLADFVEKLELAKATVNTNALPK
jgi:excisionase family DNA binding protein